VVERDAQDDEAEPGPPERAADPRGCYVEGVKITMYTMKHCPFCRRAKQLLDGKGFAYEEIDASHDDALRTWLVEETGQMTVPQIFAGERSLGGFSDIDALDRQGKLDPILRGEAG